MARHRDNQANVRSTTQRRAGWEAEEKGQDAVVAGFDALFEACADLAPIATGELMTSGHDRLSEISTYLLAGGVVRHISLSTNQRLKRFFTSQSQDPNKGLHE